MRINSPLFAIIVAAAFVFGSLAPAAFTQQQPQAPPAVYVVGFMKVDPEKVPEYLRVEREIWKPVHQERIRTGRMRSWSLYRVRYPIGTSLDYNFATVNVYSSFEDDNLPIMDVFAKVHPTVAFEQILSRTFASRSMVRGEVWDRLEHVQ